MKNRTSKTMAAIASLAMAASAFAAFPVYAEDEFPVWEVVNETQAEEAQEPEEIIDDNSEAEVSATASYSTAQKAAYNAITAACNDFVESDVSLSTNAFKIVTLNSGLSLGDMGTVVSDIKGSGSYAVLNNVGLYSSAGNTTYDKITLFTKEEYRTAAGREDAKVKLAITSQPQSVSVAAGATHKFTVAASGTGLTYQWQLNKGSGWVNSAGEGNKTNTLTQAGIQSSWNGYKYRCIIKDASGNTVTSSEAVLTVK